MKEDEHKIYHLTTAIHEAIKCIDEIKGLSDSVWFETVLYRARGILRKAIRPEEEKHDQG